MTTFCIAFYEFYLSTDFSNFSIHRVPERLSLVEIGSPPPSPTTECGNLWGRKRYLAGVWMSQICLRWDLLLHPMSPLPPRVKVWSFSKIMPSTPIIVNLDVACRIFSKNWNQRRCPLRRPLQRSNVVSIDLATLPFFNTKAMSSTCWVEGRGIGRR